MFYLSVFFFFEQKTAYKLRISDWSSDVCSSALAPFAARRIGEEQIAERPRLGPIMPLDQPFEDQHVLVLMIEHDALQRPIKCIGRGIQHRRVPLGADRTGRHEEAVADAADPRDRKGTRLNSSH